jgi:hypothetical protein
VVNRRDFVDPGPHVVRRSGIDDQNPVNSLRAAHANHWKKLRSSEVVESRSDGSKNIKNGESCGLIARSVQLTIFLQDPRVYRKRDGTPAKQDRRNQKQEQCHRDKCDSFEQRSFSSFRSLGPPRATRLLVSRHVHPERNGDYRKDDCYRKRDCNDADPSTEQLLKRNQREGVSYRDMRSSKLGSLRDGTKRIERADDYRNSSRQRS